jgi:hypothetical protein
MVEVALEDKVMAKMYGRVVFKFLNKLLEVCLHACVTAPRLSTLDSRRMDQIAVSCCAGRVFSSILSLNARERFAHRRIPD